MDCNRDVELERKILVSLRGVYSILPSALLLQRKSSELVATSYFPGKRYGRNTTNVVEIMYSWIVEERKLSIIDLFCSTHYGGRTWTSALVIFRRPRSTVLQRFSRNIQPSCPNIQCNSAITSLFDLLISNHPLV